MSANNIYLRGATWWVQLKIPRELLHHYPVAKQNSGKHQKSLFTKDKAEAKRLARLEVAKWENEFQQLRSSQLMIGDELVELAKEHSAHILREDDEKRRRMPTQADIEAEEDRVYRSASANC